MPSSIQRMSKPNDLLHEPTAPFAAIPRTRAYRECGVPVIHGSAIGTAATGLLMVVSSHAIELPEKFGSVERTSSYFAAPRDGFHANAGVRGKVVVPFGKPGRSARRAVGATSSARAAWAGARTAACAPPATASTAKETAATRTSGIPLGFSAATRWRASLERGRPGVAQRPKRVRRRRAGRRPGARREARPRPGRRTARGPASRAR